MSDNEQFGLSRGELLWRRYAIGIDLYKFYVDTVVKALVAYYAITGAILSFYFAHVGAPVARGALGLPILVSFALAALFLWGARHWRPVRGGSLRLANELGFRGYELKMLQLLLNGGAILLIATGAGTVILLVYR